jgi:circadian clock protein KaiB
MTRKKRGSGTGSARAARAEASSDRYVLRLYVTGASACSLRAIANVTALCEEHLKGSYDLEVLDIYRYPEMLREDQIVAVPALVKRLPAPQRLLVGDLSRAERVLAGLGITALRS